MIFLGFSEVKKVFFKVLKQQLEAKTAIKHGFLLHRFQSYMSAHVLMNLLSELRKIDKMRGLPSILYLFRYEFNKSNNTGERRLDSIYHKN